MSKVYITPATTGGSGSGGNLQLLNGAAMDATLRAVSDTSNTQSPLKLSTTGVQTLSKLQITTADSNYIDAEDNSGNNRFTVGRDPSSQIVNIDFGSNPTGLTQMVGGIRTYTDGVNLGTIMSFRKDGYVGVGTSSPSELLHIYNTALADIYTKIQTTQSRTAGVITQNSTANWFNGVQYSASNAYQVFDQQNNRLQLTLFNDGNSQFATSNTSLGAKLGIKGSGSTSATTSLLVQNSGGTDSLKVRDDGVTICTFLEMIGEISTRVASQNLNLYGNSNGTAGNGTQIWAWTGSAWVETLKVVNNTNPSVIIGSATYDASAKLKIDSTISGFLPPRMTDAQIRAIVAPAEGLVAYNTTISHLCCYQAGAWVKLSHSPM